MKRIFIAAIVMSMGTMLSGARPLNVNQELLMALIIQAHVQQENIVRIEEQENTQKPFQKKRRCHEIKNNRKDRPQHARINKHIKQPRAKGRT
jgi:Tfp pilus assembly protein PilN